MAANPIRSVLQSLHRAGLTDAELLARFVAARDETAFEVLVWRHSALVLSLCRRILGQEQDAEDAFQATFLTLARRAGSISSGQALGSWLYKVAYRIALAARRQSIVRIAAEQRLRRRPCWQAPDDGADRDLQALLDEEIQRLPEKYRSAILLCYFEGKTNEAAAAEIGCPKGTLLSRLARARNRLRRRLTVRGVEAPSLLVPGFGGMWRAAVPRELLKATCNAALAKETWNSSAGPVSARVLTLAQGAMRTMLWTKLRFAMSVVTVGILGVGSAGWAAKAFSSPQAIDPPGAAPVAAAATAPDAPQDQPRPVPRGPRSDEARLRSASMNNLKQILLAMHNYHDVNNHFPAPAVYSPDGKALLSWRVELLPYLEQLDLYKQFRRDEPWDSPSNRRLLSKMPPVFALPGSAQTDRTYYQVFVGPGAAFEKHKGRRISEFADGTSNTLMVAEAASPVPWTKPEDLAYDPDQPLPELGGAFKDVFHVSMADGSAHAIPRDVDRHELRKIITCNGGEAVNFERLSGSQARRNGEDRQQQSLDGLVHGYQGLLDEVMALKAEVKRLKQRVEKLESDR
jgi:RNA polymerase sigma factor (sigma-70 family)